MALPFESSAFKDIVVVLGAAGLVIPAFAALRISPVVGFILVGIAAGPFGLGALSGTIPALQWVSISDPDVLAAPAEIGIAMLLFALGLDLSLDRIRTMRHTIFGLGPAQLGLCTAVLLPVLLLIGMSIGPALALAAALALSSTAVGLQMLSSSGRMGSHTGRTALGMLLFQDLALAPLLLLIGAGTAAGGFGASLGIGVATLAGIALAAKLIVPALFLQAARTRRSELFLAAALVVLIGSAAVAAAAGLSPAVGALVAGLMLAETDYRRQIEAAVQPFEGLLLGVFLIWVGMRIDLAAIAAQPLLLLAGVVTVIGLKAAVIFMLLRWQKRSPGVAGHVALLMASPSETSLVVLAAALTAGLTGGLVAELVLAVASVSLALAPLLGMIGARFESGMVPHRHDQTEAPLPGHTVIIGFGRVGQLVAAMLEAHEQPWLAVDSDPDEVQRLRLAGKAVIYGDARRPELLATLRLETARAVVLTIDAARALDTMVGLIRERHPDLCVVVRARDAEHAGQLYARGVTDAVPETVESSLQLAEAVLIDLGVPMGRVIASVHEKRGELRAIIQGSGGKATLPRRSSRLRKAD